MTYLTIYLFHKFQNNETISDKKAMSIRLKKSNDRHNSEIIKSQEIFVTAILQRTKATKKTKASKIVDEDHIDSDDKLLV